MEFYLAERGNCSYIPLPPVSAAASSSQSTLLSFISDEHLSLLVGPIAYIISSSFFHIIDVLDLFPHYKIHPSPEELKRNRVSRLGCLVAVARYHLMTASIGYLLMKYGGDSAPGVPDDVAVAQWAGTIRHLESYVPSILTALAVDSNRLASHFKSSVAAYSLLASKPGCPAGPNAAFAWEHALAWSLHHILAPTFRLLVNLVVVDTYIYFGHRACHVNRTLYRWVHAQHHQLYVPYAYGAAYASPLESLILDTISYMFANWVSGVTLRESMLFTILATTKTVFDHCGYEFPSDLFVKLNPNGPKYHDWHHQMPGFRYNYSSYLSVWDDLLGTRATIRDRKKAIANGSALAVEGEDACVKVS